MTTRPLPTPSLVVLIGPPASGTSTWAAENFDPAQVVSTDALRGVVGEHELDLGASGDALIVLGSDPADLRERIERLRPQTQGPDQYAAAANAGTIDDHEAGVRALARAGVGTAIVSTPDVTDRAVFAMSAELIGRCRD